MLRIGGGALFRYQLATAPVVGAGLEVRYPVAEQLAFIGSIEDDAAALPRQVFVSCAPLFGNVVCTNYVYGDKVQHNVGFVVAVEWRP